MVTCINKRESKPRVLSREYTDSAKALDWIIDNIRLKKPPAEVPNVGESTTDSTKESAIDITKNRAGH